MERFQCTHATSTRRKLGRVLGSIVLLLILAPHDRLAADEWTQVANGGLGSSHRLIADFVTIHRGYIYASSSEPFASTTMPSVFRATLRNDDFWEEVSPPWTFESGDVTGMVVFHNQLHVSTSIGEIWRLGFDDVWVELTPGWTSTGKILALGLLEPSATEPSLCAARQRGFSLQIWCGSGDSGWQELDLPIGIDAADFSSIQMKSFRGDWYVGIGTQSEGDIPCRMWKFGAVSTEPAITGEWSNITLDCFGLNLTWVASLEAFYTLPNSFLFIGTGGHNDDVLILKTDGRTVEDAAPRNLYTYEIVGTTLPVRFGSMAVVGDRLFAGNRMTQPFTAQVISTTDGVTWEHSNTPGFGAGNDVVTSLAAFDSQLYAGTYHSEGFQIWRRTPEIRETIPFLFDHYRDMIAIRIPLIQCLIPFDPTCGFDLGPLQEQLGWIELGVLRSEFKNKLVYQQAIADVKQVSGELFNAQTFAGQAKKAQTFREAQVLATRAASHLNQAMQLTHKTLVKIQTGILPE